MHKPEWFLSKNAPQKTVRAQIGHLEGEVTHGEATFLRKQRCGRCGGPIANSGCGAAEDKCSSADRLFTAGWLLAHRYNPRPSSPDTPVRKVKIIFKP